MATQAPAPVDAAVLGAANSAVETRPTAISPVADPELPQPTPPVRATARAAESVPPVTDPELPQPQIVVVRPQVEEPAPDPYPETGTAPVIPQPELPVDTANTEIPVDPNITPAGVRYISVLANGEVIVSQAASIDFAGSAVMVTGSGSEAVITISDTSIGNSDIAAFMAAFGDNTITTTGNITAGYVLGNGSQLTGLPVQYSNSNVTVLLAAFGSNSISTTGNISAGYVLGNGSQLTGLPEAYGNGNVVTLLSALGSNSISTTGNITASYVLGNGSQLTSLPYANRIQNGNSNVTIDTGDGDAVISVGTKTWTFEVNGNTTIPGNILGVDGLTLDNRFAEVMSDIQLFSADDILLQGRDRPLGSDLEGGDINILAGDSGDDNGVFPPASGGDVLIEGGRGGAGNVYAGGAGGSVTIRGGTGGAGSVTAQSGAGNGVDIEAGDGGEPGGGGGARGGNITITAGSTTNAEEDRGSITLTSGGGGDETTNGGYVEINIPAEGTNPGGSWTFTGYGTVLNTPANAEIFGANFGNITVGTWGNTIVRTLGAGLENYDWVFDPTGNITLPTSGNIVGATTDNSGSLQWIGNSSGDGNGYTTLELRPDDTVSGTDQYIVLDPTAPGHIHIRAGGTQDNTNAALFLGGENSYFQVPAGANTEVYVTANSHVWTFSNDGSLSVTGNINFSGDASAAPSLNDFFGVTSAVGFDIVANSAGTVQTWTFDADGDLAAPGNISLVGNITGTSANVDLVAGIYTSTFDNTGNVALPGNMSAVGDVAGTILISTNSIGDEGGEIQLAASANANISGVVIDSYNDIVRIFEEGGTSRGVQIDLSKAPAGVGGELLWKASAVVNAGVDVTLGNLKAQIPSSGNRSVQVSTGSGSYTVTGSSVYSTGGTVSGSTINAGTPVVITTTPGYLNASYNFVADGTVDTWNIYDVGNNIGWRITTIIGLSYANNMISIERLL